MLHNRWTSISTGISSSYVKRWRWAELRAKLTSELASEVIPARPARILLSTDGTVSDDQLIDEDGGFDEAEDGYPLVEKEDFLSSTAHPRFSTFPTHPFAAGSKRKIQQFPSHFLRIENRMC